MLLWEILTFGELPLTDLKTNDIIDLAQSHELVHPRYNNYYNLSFLILNQCNNHNYWKGWELAIVGYPISVDLAPES